MKKISLLLITMLILVINSCKNEEWEFPDFDYVTTYFPYQYPVRTLVLGDYIFDNENDNDHRFKISARVGGMYNNHSDWTVKYQVESSLVENLATAPNLFDGKSQASADTLKVLPSHYYTLTPGSQFVVTKGSFIGEIEVQLTDDFFNDPLAVKTNYVIPLRIISSTTDSVLAGHPLYVGADPRKATEWVIAPKDFTIFGIKYVNPYHGKYLHRGVSVITDTSTSLVLDTIIYREKYVEQDELWALQTVGRTTVRTGGTLRQKPASPGSFSMDITFDSNNNCIISTSDGSAFTVSGTGRFVKGGDMWGNIPRDAIHLNYIVTDGVNKHTITDTLVFRDKAVIFQEFVPAILP